MLEIHERLAEPVSHDVTLTLPFDLRQKSRLRATLDDGTAVGLFLPRGTMLRHGDCLRAHNGRVISVQAAAETVSTVSTSTTEPLQLIRAAYHLGNRHVPLQIGLGWLRYRHDHVLDEMVVQLGLQVTIESAAFEPEAGAYGGGHHHHHD